MRNLLPALFLFVAPFLAFSQDTRNVTEPTIPQSCTVLSAKLTSILNGATLHAPDEMNPDTDRIQQAMDHCKEGQAVELKADGEHDAFLAGPLDLRQGVTLLIDKGVILFGSRNPRDYDILPGFCGTVTEKKYPYVEGQSGHWCKPLLSGVNISNAGIMGDGIIDGRGGAKLLGQDVTWWDVDEESLKTWPDEYVEWARGIGIFPEPITKPALFFGLQNDPRMINLLHCDSFILYRIHLRNAPNFHVSYAGGNGFTIWGVMIDTPKSALNSDGIDIGQPWPLVYTDTTNVTIAHSYIHAGDDDLAIKSRTGSSTSNVTVNDVHIYTGGGMGTGSSTTGNISHIRVNNLTVDGAGAGINMKSSNKLGGVVQDVQFDNVCIRDSKNPIHLWTHHNSYGHHEVDATETNKPPVYLDIRFNNVTIVGGGKVMLDGYDADRMLGLSFHNVMAAQPEALQMIVDNANINVDGSNLNLAGDNVKITGASSKGTANNCDGRFVPYPIPFSNLREIPAVEGQ